jgi:hypothetical protein
MKAGPSPTRRPRPVARLETIMETLAWLAARHDRPMDRHGHLAAEESAERDEATRV